MVLIFCSVTIISLKLTVIIAGRVKRREKG